MQELYVIAEGHAEETFVRDLLAPHLGAHGVAAYVQRITTRDDTRHLGGRTIRKLNRGGHGGTYKHIRRDIENCWSQHHRRGIWLTTFLDLYHLPPDMPGYQDSSVLTDPFDRATALERAMAADLSHCQLIPYIQVHEFESLIFADPGHLDLLCETDAERRALHGLIRSVTDIPPERIDGGEATHPARRIVDVFQKRYAKPTDGNIVLSLIGMPRLLERLPRFAAWVGRLAVLGS